MVSVLGIVGMVSYHNIGNEYGSWIMVPISHSLNSGLRLHDLLSNSALKGLNYWVAVKEPRLSYHSLEIMIFTMCIYIYTYVCIYIRRVFIMVIEESSAQGTRRIQYPYRKYLDLKGLHIWHLRDEVYDM